MLRQILLFAFIIFSGQFIYAQQVQGTVADRATQLRLGQVEVSNLTTKEKTTTNAKGEFSIRAAINQSLSFYQPGYTPDTLFLVDLKAVKRYLNLSNKLLNTVEINAGGFHPEIEYANIYRAGRSVTLQQNKPFRFSPSRIFGSEGKAARRFKRIMERERTEREIDKRFNVAAVKALTPLKGEELDYFMVLYRPTLKELDKLDQEDLKFYLMNAYKEFKALPADKRVSPLLQTQ
jgi:hypothetical protein